MTYNENQKRLIAAARNGDLEGLKQLIGSGFDVDCELKYGASALMLAAGRGQNETVKLLLSAGAKVNRRNRFGATALYEASEKGHLDTIKTLVEHGAEINLPHNNGNTALLAAAMRRDRKVIKMLLELGANPEIKNFDGWSARTWAEAESDLTIQSLFGIKRVEVEQVLHKPMLSRQEEVVNERKSAAVVQGAFWTIFMRAASSGDVDTIRRLIDEGIEVNAQSPNGTTALIAAVKNGHADTALELLELGADITIEDIDGLTALAWAKQKGHVAIVQALEARASSMGSEAGQSETDTDLVVV